jgi:type I restriction enzyme S subunit
MNSALRNLHSALVRPGYKQTEVGVTPEDWGIGTLGNVGRWFSGGTPSMANKVYWGGEIPWVSAKDMKTSRIYDSQLHVTEQAIGNGTRLAPSGAVLIVVRGMILAHTLPVAVAKRPVAFNQDMKAVTICAEVHGEFILLWLQANARTILGMASESTHGTKRIPSEDLFAVKLALPPKLEQHAIAEALSDVDGLLGGLDRLIGKKRDLKQAAMQQLLTGQTRLPGFQLEWQVRRLREIAHIKTGSRNNEDKVEDGQYPFFVRSENVERINSYCHNCEAILVPGEGRIGNIFHYIHGRFDVHQRVYAITRFRPGVSAKFVYLYMAKNFGAWAMQNTVKATVDSLRLPTFQNFEVEMPPTFEEQTAIAEVLTEMDTELAGLEQRGEKTRALKQAMMQELLTGRTRLV